jgi:hypothetical protein
MELFSNRDRPRQMRRSLLPWRLASRNEAEDGVSCLFAGTTRDTYREKGDRLRQVVIGALGARVAKIITRAGPAVWGRLARFGDVPSLATRRESRETLQAAETVLGLSCKTSANVERQQRRRRVSGATAVVVNVRHGECRRQLRAQNGFIIAGARPRWSRHSTKAATYSAELLEYVAASPARPKRDGRSGGAR